MADEGFDELYGDLYGDVEVPVPTAPPPIPAAAAHPQVATTPAAPSLQNPAAIPSFDSAAPNTGRASLPPMPYGGGQQPQQQQQQPPPLHFDAGYSQRAQEQNRSLNVRPSDMPDEGKMFIGGLNWDTTDDSLRTYFEQFGKITHCTIMRDPETHRSRGFAFLTFEEPQSVNSVMATEHYLDGKTIDPKRAIPRSEGQKTDKLFVRSIPNSCTQESFRSYWRAFGSITDATLMMDKESGRHRGFGFVNYENLESVEKVLSTGPHMMDGQMLEVKRAQAKGETRRPDYGTSQNQSYQPAPAPQSQPGQFDPATMAKFFQQMGWGAWNPMMMGGIGMPGMGGPMPGMGMPGMGGPMGGPMGGMGMGGPMGGMGMGGPMGGFGGMGIMGMPGMGGMSGGDPSMGMYAGGDYDGAGGMAGGPGVSPWTAPMAQQPMRGGGGMRGGMRGGRGRGGGSPQDFNPPTGPAAMRGAGTGGASPDANAGAGPTRSRGGGSGYHPYAR